MSGGVSARPPVRGAGDCNRCGRYCANGLVYPIEQGTGAIARVVLCADAAACRKRRGRRL
jgi:hypothetical protein